MKTKFKLLMSSAVLLTTILLTSCNIESEGPIGPPGNNGWSDIKIITYDIWSNEWLRDNSEPNYWYNIYITNLVDYYVLDQGAVLFYYGTIENDGYVNKWYFIPFTNVYWDDKYSDYFETIYDATYSNKTLEITIRDTNPDVLTSPETNDIRIKAVILEGEQYSMIMQKEVDVKNFNEVKGAFEVYHISQKDEAK
ncbi:hypothetical protein ACFLSQ_09665 [Bacteroidota bacterium]